MSNPPTGIPRLDKDGNITHDSHGKALKDYPAIDLSPEELKEWQEEGVSKGETYDEFTNPTQHEMNLEFAKIAFENINLRKKLDDAECKLSSLQSTPIVEGEQKEGYKFRGELLKENQELKIELKAAKLAILKTDYRQELERENEELKATLKSLQVEGEKEDKIQKAIGELKIKISNCPDNTKESRARKGAYVDSVQILQSIP